MSRYFKIYIIYKNLKCNLNTSFKQDIIYEKKFLVHLDQFEIRDLLSLDAPLLGNIHISIN